MATGPTGKKVPELETISIARYESRSAEEFTCFLCNQKKESNVRVFWYTIQGMKRLCDDCYQKNLAGKAK